METLNEPRTPTQLSELIGSHRPNVIRSLLALHEKGLVECITPDESMGRYYKITDIGKSVLAKKFMNLRLNNG